MADKSRDKPRSNHSPTINNVVQPFNTLSILQNPFLGYHVLCLQQHTLGIQQVALSPVDEQKRENGKYKQHVQSTAAYQIAEGHSSEVGHREVEGVLVTERFHHCTAVREGKEQIGRHYSHACVRAHKLHA